ncbi:MAG: hypothetical protein H6625_14135 [Bdellovibrionaceae bacterium]|nr:hypothetical protein [Pseudobdellovibrionaceae bacterium]
MKIKNINKRIKVGQLISKDIVVNPVRLPNGDIGRIEYHGNGKQVVGEKEFIHEGKEYVISLPNFNQKTLSLPTGVGVFEDVDKLYEGIKRQLECSIKYSSEEELILSTSYILATYNFKQYPNICYKYLTGYPGSGKTQDLQATHHLSYNSVYFSGLATESSIFRTIDAVKGTLCLDESQTKATDMHSPQHKLLAVANNKHGNVPRATQIGDSKNFEPESYEVFGPKVFSGRSVPGEDAIVQRCLGIHMKAAPTELVLNGSLLDINSKEWQIRAEKLKNDLTLYHQMRAIGELEAPNNLDNIKEHLSRFSLRDYQVYGWLLYETPGQDNQFKLLKGIMNYKDQYRKRREEHFEPTVLNCAFDLLSKNPEERIYITDIQKHLDINFGIKVHTRQISTVFDRNEIEKLRDKRSRYILATPDLIAEKLVLLGYQDPRSIDISTSSTSKREF